MSFTPCDHIDSIVFVASDIAVFELSPVTVTGADDGSAIRKTMALHGDRLVDSPSSGVLGSFPEE